MRPPLPWQGFLLGFLFGTAGLWLVALLRLALPAAELLTEPLYHFGRMLAEIAVRDGSAGTGAVLLLMAANGIFYGLVGAAVQLVLRWMR